MGIENKRFDLSAENLPASRLTAVSSYGLIADIIECLIQRCFSYNTLPVRETNEYVKACLIDPTVTKVVLIGHSQGGIIISLVLDDLFTDLSSKILSKLASIPQRSSLTNS